VLNLNETANPVAGPSASDRLVGIVSGGANGCGQKGSPGFYTSVADIRPWVVSQIDAVGGIGGGCSEGA
jgi:secreted trypsin-like serine protease